MNIRVLEVLLGRCAIALFFIPLSMACLSGCEDRSSVEPVKAAEPSPAPSAIEPPTHAPAAAGTNSARPDASPYTTTGPLIADRQADIAAERDGRVAEIAVEIGDSVQTGQLMAALDDRMARAMYESQKAKVESLQDQVKEWQAEQKTEEADLRRADAMRAEKISTEEDWEHVKYKLDETIQEVARYRADEAGAEADLKLAELQLEQCRITAPFAGVVARRSLRPAQEVKKGDVLFWITAVAPLRIVFTVPESAMAQFPVGAGLQVTTPVYPELRQAAHVDRVSPVVDPASGSVQVIGVLDHPQRLLKLGMTMQVQAAGPTAKGRARP